MKFEVVIKDLMAALNLSKKACPKLVSVNIVCSKKGAYLLSSFQGTTIKVNLANATVEATGAVTVAYDTLMSMLPKRGSIAAFEEDGNSLNFSIGKKTTGKLILVDYDDSVGIPEVSEDSTVISLSQDDQSSLYSLLTASWVYAQFESDSPHFMLRLGADGAQVICHDSSHMVFIENTSISTDELEVGIPTDILGSTLDIAGSGNTETSELTIDNGSIRISNQSLTFLQPTEYMEDFSALWERNVGLLDRLSSMEAHQFTVTLESLNTTIENIANFAQLSGNVVKCKLTKAGIEFEVSGNHGVLRERIKYHGSATVSLVDEVPSTFVLSLPFLKDAINGCLTDVLDIRVSERMLFFTETHGSINRTAALALMV